MQDAPRQALQELVRKYGPALSEDERRLDGLLRDHVDVGSSRREATVLHAWLGEESSLGKRFLHDARLRERLDLSRVVSQSFQDLLGVLAQ
jgi:hypothetical protein